MSSKLASAIRARGSSAIVALLVVVAGSVAYGDSGWRLRQAADLPPWLDLGLSSRMRLEHLTPDFRGERDRDSTALVLRTQLTAAAHVRSFELGLELIDSRAFADDDAALNTTSVNVFEILQAYAGTTRTALMLPKDRLDARIGRLTIDLGSRRLLARNRFRNTINSFTGADVSYACGCGHELRLVAAMPVVRLPTARERLADNEHAFDEEDTDAVVLAFLYRSPHLPASLRVELYGVSIHEGDGPHESRNRELWTPGLRVYREPARGELDTELEGMVQLGSSRASANPADTADLDHRAYFVHAELGYTIPRPWSPRLVSQFDHASGDDDPTDDSNERFDTLFGARRFELGPTGIFGAFARSNLGAFGFRVEVTPSDRVTAFASHRSYWLASPQDAWVTTGLVDPNGRSGRLLGSQTEGRVRWQVLPGNLAIELGIARLVLAGFANQLAPKPERPTLYLYSQLTGTI